MVGGVGAILTAVPPGASAGIINVPADSPSIQDGILAADPGDVVVVAPGTYTEHIDFKGKAVTVQSASGPEVTTIDGGSVIGADVVRFVTNEGLGSVLRGFTIQNAGIGSRAIGIYGASPTITENTVRLTNGTSAIGVSGGSPELTRNLVTDNVGCPGGAGIDLSFSSAVVQGNRITNNRLGCVGGNVGGAGIRIIGGGAAQIIGNTIEGNDATGSPGGGIALFGAGTPIIRDNLIRNNVASEGGGIGYDENGIAEGDTIATIVQNLIVGNRAAEGGGLSLHIFAPASEFVLTNNTIADNSGGAVTGVFLAGQFATSQFFNNIVMGEISCDPASGAPPPTFSHNNVSRYTGSCAGTTGTNGNISVVPHFLNAAGGDYRLQFASLSLDAGSNSAPSLPLTDLDGAPRIAGGLVDQGAYELAATPPDASGEFTPLTPSRILDTRDGTGRDGIVGPVEGSSVDVQITGRGGVPVSGVSAVVLNATVTQPTAQSHLTIWPAGLAMPLISNLNYVAGQTVPNLVTVAVGAGGKVSVHNLAGTSHVIFDVVGYYASATGPFGSRFHGVRPFRYFDTRDGTGGVPARALGPGEVLKFDVTNKGGVPGAGVTGVVMNVTVTEPTASSHLTVHPDDVVRPLASNLNFGPGLTVPNLVVVRVPGSGVVDFFNLAGTAHVIADVVGYYDGEKSTSAGRFVGLTPVRRFDSRVSSPFPPPGAVSEGATLLLRMPGTVGLPASGVGSMVLNVTVTQPTTGSFVTVSPSDQPRPVASNLNFVAGQTVPNLVMAKVSAGPPPAPAPQTPGWIDFFNAIGSTHLVVDVFGYFTASFTDVTGGSVSGSSAGVREVDAARLRP